jgi:hypothetical protein
MLISRPQEITGFLGWASGTLSMHPRPIRFQLADVWEVSNLVRACLGLCWIGYRRRLYSLSPRKSKSVLLSHSCILVSLKRKGSLSVGAETSGQDTGGSFSAKTQRLTPLRATSTRSEKREGRRFLILRSLAQPRPQ